MKGFHVRPGNGDDIRRFYGHDLPFTARVWVAEENGEVVALAGYYLNLQGHVLVFSRITDAMRRRPLTIVREARRLLSRITAPVVFCIADRNESGSCRFLEWLGWQHVSSTDDGEVYAWRTH